MNNLLGILVITIAKIGPVIPTNKIVIPNIIGINKSICLLNIFCNIVKQIFQFSL